ncbi:MAG: (2Fe-2S) ferredoxin domain-containing protein [Armatimonadota bacterium]|nr:MAG: (2Fe-2S) ferredoxin domain-containing protein [Armatimonadota bacterium]
MLKNVKDLEKMRQEVRASLAARESAGGARLVVAMGTCGIAAGAREVVAALMDEIEKRKLQDITITQSGCKGLCDREPTLDVLRPGETSITYGDVTPDAARRIVAEHIMGGNVVKEFVLFTGDAGGAKA